MNKHNPTKESTKACALLYSRFAFNPKTKLKEVQNFKRDSVQLNLNGSIISNKPLSRRDKHRQEVRERKHGAK